MPLHAARTVDMSLELFAAETVSLHISPSADSGYGTAMEDGMGTANSEQQTVPGMERSHERSKDCPY